MDKLNPDNLDLRSSRGRLQPTLFIGSRGAEMYGLPRLYKGCLCGGLPTVTRLCRPFTLPLAMGLAHRSVSCANLVDKGGYDEPIADLTEAIRLDPSLAAAFVFRGIARSKKGFAKQLVSEFDRAIADFTEAIRIDPNYANAYQKRAMAYGGKLDHDQAIADSSITRPPGST